MLQSRNQSIYSHSMSTSPVLAITKHFWGDFKMSKEYTVYRDIAGMYSNSIACLDLPMGHRAGIIKCLFHYKRNLVPTFRLRNICIYVSAFSLAVGYNDLENIGMPAEIQYCTSLIATCCKSNSRESFSPDKTWVHWASCCNCYCHYKWIPPHRNLMCSQVYPTVYWSVFWSAL